MELVTVLGSLFVCSIFYIQFSPKPPTTTVSAAFDKLRRMRTSVGSVFLDPVPLAALLQRGLLPSLLPCPDPASALGRPLLPLDPVVCPFWGSPHFAETHSLVAS